MKKIKCYLYRRIQRYKIKYMEVRNLLFEVIFFVQNTEGVSQNLANISTSVYINALLGYILFCLQIFNFF